VVFDHENLEERGVDIPAYVRFGNSLRTAGLYAGSTILTEQQAIAVGKGALA
jgi:hypothetical protein